MTALPILRLTALGTVVVFSLIVLGLSSHLTYLTNTFFDGYYAFAALAIATAVLSITSISAMIIIDFLRKGAFTSMIVVELSWLGLLWILWLASGASAADATRRTFSGCRFRNSFIQTACREFSAIQAFCFLNWLILLGYTSTLAISCVTAAGRGHNVWNSSVKETDFNAPAQHSHTDKAQEYTSDQTAGIPQVAYAAPGGTTPMQYPPQTGGVQGWVAQPTSPQSIPTSTPSPYPQV